MLQQLENNEAILLMYLAGELCAEDRAEVEQMLAGDAGLRAALAELDRLQASFNGSMSKLDREPLPVPEQVGVRLVGRAMRQWQAEQLARRPALVEEKSGLRYPWWVYPTASAAAILLAFIVWWGMKTDVPENLVIVPTTQPWQSELPLTSDPDPLRMQPSASEVRLRETEKDLAALYASADLSPRMPIGDAEDVVQP
ncbi:MAG TPA: hypothetical protein VIL86_00680 [Tepidisphaeraceae bacterium]